jgi:phospholipid/cholesterol/gamma-HCH transport system substrate-binding protein
VKRPTFVTWDQLKVGALIIVSLGLVAYAIMRLGSAMHLFSPRYTLNTFLPSASGLRVGGGVSVAGQPAGVIRRIEYLPIDADTNSNILVVLEIDQQLREQVRSDSRAYIRTLGLLGDKTLDVTPGTAAARPLEEGDTLLAAGLLDYDRILSRAADAVEDMVVLTADLRAITSGLAAGEGTLGLLLRDRKLYDELSTALRSSNGLLARARDSKGTLAKLLDDTTLYQQMLTSFSSVDSVARRFASDRGTVGRLLSDSTVYLTINSAALTADSLLKSLARGEGSAGKMLKDDVLYAQLLRSVSELTAILEDFRKNPARYTRGIIRIF